MAQKNVFVATPGKKRFFAMAMSIRPKWEHDRLVQGQKQMVEKVQRLLRETGAATPLRAFVEDRGAYNYVAEEQAAESARRSWPIYWTLYDFLAKLSQTTPAATERKGNEQILKVIRQLIELGHGVEVHHYDNPALRKFVRIAERRGAKAVKRDAATDPHIWKVPPDFFRTGPNQPTPPEYLHRWARDQYARIGPHRVQPAPYFRKNKKNIGNAFGEGGGIIPLNEREAITSASYKNAPRLKELQRRGIRFHFVPNGMVYQEMTSRVMGKPTYYEDEHIDYVLNAIPEKGVIAVDFHYYRQHKAEVEALRRKSGLRKLIVTRKEESKLHPTNFLDLGDGRVLVNRSCGHFIKDLRSAGVEVVETAVPVDEFTHYTGGLRCFFNEVEEK